MKITEIQQRQGRVIPNLEKFFAYVCMYTIHKKRKTRGHQVSVKSFSSNLARILRLLDGTFQRWSWRGRRRGCDAEPAKVM